MIKKLVILSIAVFLGACSTVKYNYTPKVKSFSIPSLGKEVSAGLGEPLLDQGLSIDREILRITEESKVSAYRINPGKLIKIGQDESSSYYAQDAQSGFIIFAGLLMSYPDPTATIQRKNNGELCVMRPTDVTVCGEIHARVSSEKVITNESFRQTLIYSGRVGDKLKINYREFSKDYARTAFNTDAEYDLSESNIIGYAGSRIQVISATNTEIEYKVMKNFNTK